MVDAGSTVGAARKIFTELLRSHTIYLMGRAAQPAHPEIAVPDSLIPTFSEPPSATPATIVRQVSALERLPQSCSSLHDAVQAIVTNPGPLFDTISRLEQAVLREAPDCTCGDVDLDALEYLILEMGGRTPPDYTVVPLTQEQLGSFADSTTWSEVIRAAAQ